LRLRPNLSSIPDLLPVVIIEALLGQSWYTTSQGALAQFRRQYK
jgi:hypothetical protein